MGLRGPSNFWTSRQGKFVAPVAVTTSTFLAFLPLAWWGFDAHHNGLMLATATGVSQGKAIHSEVFTQYGPITSWSQAPFVFLGGGSAVALTIWATVLISLTAGLVAAIPNFAPRGFGISHRISVPSAIVWVLLAPSWAMGGIQTWSSVMASCLLMAASTFSLIGIRMRDEGKLMRARYFWAASGAIVGVMPFTRLNVGLVLWLLLLVGLSLFWRSRLWDRHDRGAFISGWITSASVVLLILGAAGSLGDYLDQSIVTPYFWALEQQSDPEYFFGLFWSDITYLAQRALPLALAAIFLDRLVVSKFGHSPVRVSLRVVAAVLATASFLFAVRAQRVVDWYRGKGPDELKNLVLFTGEESHLAIWYFFFLSTIVILLAFGLIIKRYGATLSRLPTSALRGYSFMAVGGLANLVQIHPLGDPFHLWWGSPMMALFLVKALGVVHKTTQLQIWLPSVLILAAIQIALLIPGHQDRNSSGPAGTVVEHVRMTQEASLYLEGIRDLHASAGMPDEDKLYFVQMGIEVVIDGNFNSANPVFANWAILESEPPGLESWTGKTMIDYPGLKKFGYESFESLALEYDLDVVGCSFAAEPYYFSDWDTDNPYICILEPSRNQGR